MRGSEALTQGIVDRVLFTEEQIQQKIKELGAQISADYAGKELLLVCILKGGLMFMADLAKEISVPTAYDFISISSYGKATKSSGVVRILKDLDADIAGKHVLIVEDIIDTGLTLSYLIGNLKSRHPASLEICTLLDKPEGRRVPINIRYRGFEVPNQFIVGYGLDYMEHFRNVPFIFVMKPDLIAEE